MPIAAALLALVVVGVAAWCQGTPEAPATPKEATPAPAESAALAGKQKGLPPELTVDPADLDAEQKALDAAMAYLRSQRPAGGVPGFFSKIGKSITGFFSGKSKPQPTTLPAIMAAGGNWNGKLVSIEGLLAVRDDKLALIVGTYRAPLTKLPHTTIDGFAGEALDGLPARAEGLVIVGEQGPEINLNRLDPAPTLTPVRLARCHELRDTASDYQQAVELYLEASADQAVHPWTGFAAAHGGQIAADILRNRRHATSLYKRAWDLEGRVKSTRAKQLPVTWVQDAQSGAWDTQTLRAAVGGPLNKLNSQGFWYKFVEAFVTISGGNAGVGLILLAVGTRLLLYPLTKKQISSTRDMQRLQPQIKALQEKHGSDKQKFNEEFWKLCRDNGVNPLGGCLPLLVQMPVLIMVYRGIQAYVVELGNHDFLWVRNLADPDMPLLVLYTISMIAFQKLTMKTQPMSDPQQQQQQNMMVWMMPLMFFMFFQGLPSGFILYWLGTNLIYLPQQYFGTRVKPEEQTGEKTVTLAPRSPNPEGGPAAPAGPFAWLTKALTGEKTKEEEPPAPVSYEERKTAEKRKLRRPTRRRRRP
jgi:YidC/Oxa1 family membrane protein insertase